MASMVQDHVQEEVSGKRMVNLPQRAEASFRWLVTWRVAQGLFLAALVGVVVILSARIQDVRRDITEEQLKLEQNLNSAVRGSILKTELAKRRHDLYRIVSLLPRREAIGDVVGVMEREAQLRGVTLRVPEIEEVVELDEDGEPIEPVGPLRDVTLNVVAQGAPQAVLDFLYEIEHSPYVLEVVRWKFSTEQVAVSAGSTSLIPRVGPVSAEDSVLASRKVVSNMDMTIILMTLSNGMVSAVQIEEVQANDRP